MTVAFPCHYATVHYILQYRFMLPLEVVDPGGSLSMLLVQCLTDKTQIQVGILAGGNSEGGRKFQLDDGGTRHLPVEAAGAAAAWQLRSLCSAGSLNFVIFVFGLY
jgi:hypothetical protein